MNYNEKIIGLVDKFYLITKLTSTSRTYTFSYGWAKLLFGLDLHDDEIKSDVREMSYTGKFMDLINAIDFDDVKEEVIVMIWEKGDKTMKKYELKDYKKFCDEALVCPPIDEFENGTIDEEEWYKQHDIKITVGNHEINIGYGADEINEIEFSLREIYEAVLGDGEATTGNTFGSQYRPAELKDIVRHFIMCRYENYGGLNWFDYAQQAVVELSDITSVIGLYEHACKIEKDIDFKCNWHNFKVESLKDATEEGVKKIILDWVGSNLEISYDPHTDKSFIIDYTFKESGDFIDWSWGKIEEGDDEFNVLLDSYKTQIFEEVK
jgi:hypothetical protein